jgi:putative endonuclease
VDYSTEGATLQVSTKNSITSTPAFAGVNLSPRKRESRKNINEMSNGQYYVYILASKRNGTLYIGVTSELIKRVYEHKNNLVEGFTQKYKVHNLVYYETTDDINSVITREKQLKKWKRTWKMELIEKNNPGWRDLYFELI